MGDELLLGVLVGLSFYSILIEEGVNYEGDDPLV